MSERDDLIEQALHVPSVEVRCGDCGNILGDQFRPGDGARLFSDHVLSCPAKAELVSALPERQS